MTTQHFKSFQLELPFCVDENKDYSTVKWCSANRFNANTHPLSYMINSFQWVYAPEPSGYWSGVLNKIIIMEKKGVAYYDKRARCYGMGYTLELAFIFSSTPEGNDYWYDVVRRLRCVDRAFKARQLNLDKTGSV